MARWGWCITYIFFLLVILFWSPQNFITFYLSQKVVFLIVSFDYNWNEKRIRLGQFRTAHFEYYGPGNNKQNVTHNKQVNSSERKIRWERGEGWRGQSTVQFREPLQHLFSPTLQTLFYSILKLRIVNNKNNFYFSALARESIILTCLSPFVSLRPSNMTSLIIFFTKFQRQF